MKSKFWLSDSTSGNRSEIKEGFTPKPKNLVKPPPPPPPPPPPKKYHSLPPKEG